jgi:hypothetical protein
MMSGTKLPPESSCVAGSANTAQQLAPGGPEQTATVPSSAPKPPRELLLHCKPLSSKASYGNLSGMLRMASFGNLSSLAAETVSAHSVSSDSRPQSPHRSDAPLRQARGSSPGPQSPLLSDDSLRQALHRMSIHALLQRDAQAEIHTAPQRDEAMATETADSGSDCFSTVRPLHRAPASSHGSPTALQPFIDMLSKRRARVYTEGAQYLSQMASIAGITRIYFEPSAAHTEASPSVLRLSREDFQLLSMHMGRTTSLRQLDMVLCTFEVSAMMGLRNLRHLQRVSVCACNLSASGFSYLLHNLPTTLVALDASGNDLSCITHNGGNCLERLSSKKRKTDGSGMDVSRLACLIAMTELRLQRCSLHGNAIAALGRSMQVSKRDLLARRLWSSVSFVCVSHPS